jgi:hypothetical protein
MRAIILLLVASLVCGCDTMRRDVSEVDPYLSYNREQDGDQTVTFGGRILMRDPGLKK